MTIFRGLFINNRFFIPIAVVIGLFVVSFAFPVMFYVALALLVISILLLIVDAYWLFQKVGKFKAERNTGSLAMLHEPHQVEISVRNNTNLSLKLLLIDELPYQLEQRNFKLAFGLGAQKSIKHHYAIVPNKRGKYHFGNVLLFIHTPLGFASRRISFLQKMELAVVPSIPEMKRQELKAGKNLLAGVGQQRTRARGNSYEFDEIKPYVLGDDPRNINWKATSKVGETMLNLYEDERSQNVFSVIDKGRNMKMPFNGLSLVDYAINATLAFSNIVLKKHDKAGLVTFSHKVDTILASTSGKQQLKKINYALYAEKYDFSEANYTLLGVVLRKMLPSRSLVFIYTNFDTLDSLQRSLPALKMLNRQHKLVVVLFKNAGIDDIQQAETNRLLDIYEHHIARKFSLEKQLIVKEMQQHGIIALLTAPEQLSANVINRYLSIKQKSLV